MADNFPVLANAVAARLAELAREPLFVVASDRDTIWETYLKAFPAGTDPIFREKTTHDCSCCKKFIRDVGNVVAIQNGAVATVWDLNALPSPYQAVADAMSEYIKALPIRDVFLSHEAMHGRATSHGLINGRSITFSHFAGEVPTRFVAPKKELATRRGKKRADFDVLMRGIQELKPEAVAQVVDLIEQNALYRGEEHRRAVLEFQQLQAHVLGMTASTHPRVPLVWTLIDSPAARLRNTVIGTLIQDLSDGVELERAVRSFESKVAPQNYKRPTALITKRMVEDAMKTIGELDLEPALERRHARLSDVSVTSVLWVNNAAQGEMKGGIKGLLMEEVQPAAFDPDKATEIGIEAFVRDVLPGVKDLRLYLENSALPNFVSLTAPVHADSKRLFRWSNDFAWSYDGNVADSIKDKVKRAGGRVEDVALRISLAWSNTDDLDLHCFAPGGRHIAYFNKEGILDVDMNVQGETREPVENMRWVHRPRDGEYDVFVHNFRKRESIDVGFTVEVESAYGLHTLRYDKAVAGKQEVKVAHIVMQSGVEPTVVAAPGIVAGSVAQEKWGLKTLDLIRVNSLVLSPNYWDGNAVGNKHFFFILDGAKNPLPTRGIYNEFLSGHLEKHRKVFEVLGDKTKVPVADQQLSGVGFSSTRKERVTVVAMGPKLNKAYAIAFA